MFKNIFSVLMAMFLLAANIQVASANSGFKDVTSFKSEIEFLTSKGIIMGYPDGTFKPDNPITRLQAVQMILREKGVTDFSNVPDPGFIDAKPGTPRYGEIAKAVQLGFINGKVNAKGQKYFDPQGFLTRAQMAKILALAYDLKGSYPIAFTDVRADHWAHDSISALAANGITAGYSDGSFKPGVNLSRQHFSAFMARYLDDKFKPAKEMFAHFIDVDQGDSILIQTPNGKTILVDGGKRSAGEKVVAYLKKAGVTSIDVVVATHPDADHIGGLINVLQSIPVKKVLDSGKVHTTETYHEFLSLIDTKNIAFEVPKTGQALSIDPALKVQVLNSGDRNASDNNENSIVLKLTYGGVSYLLTGDADVKVEEDMITKFDVKSTILKAGHHGAKTSTSQAFVNAVKPAVTILSYGKDNSYGHPTDEVVSRLKAAGSKLYSTAESGDIVVKTDGKTYSVLAKPWQGTITPAPQPPAPNPTPTPAPTPTTGDARIVSKDLAGEKVGIKNFGKANINMTGWQLVSVEGNQKYTFPDGYVLKPGATVYITSGQSAKHQPPTYLKWTTANIWNNSGDMARLFNSNGVKVSEVR
ncbi:S-layer homology domain-containing protein [Bacillus sp. B190/17]|uniref:S-layer homology domain-containing protein n=1 Tax=Bacillus lumedeiriae TaxID=3058829 RepID=A0ABW8ICG6_9BACI